MSISQLIKVSILFIVACKLSSASPVPDTTNQMGNSYSGAGGSASGGSVNTTASDPNEPLGGMGLVALFSDNAGHGGKASSGHASAPAGAISATSGGTDPSTDGNTSNSMGNSFSGVGGTANGGDVNTHGTLIKLFSGNAASGGKATSGGSGQPLAFVIPASAKTAGGRKRISRVIRINLD